MSVDKNIIGLGWGRVALRLLFFLWNSDVEERIILILDGHISDTLDMRLSAGEERFSFFLLLRLELQDVAFFVDGFPIVACLGECRLFTEFFVFTVVDCTDQGRTAGFRAWNEVDRHDAFHPFTGGKIL